MIRIAKRKLYVPENERLLAYDADKNITAKEFVVAKNELKQTFDTDNTDNVQAWLLLRYKTSTKFEEVTISEPSNFLEVSENFNTITKIEDSN